MAEQFLITDIVGQSAFAQIAKLSNELQSLKKDMSELIEQGKRTTFDMLGGLKNNPTDLDSWYKKSAAYNEQQKKLNEIQKRLSDTQGKYKEVLAQANKQVEIAVREAKARADVEIKQAKAIQAQEKAEQARLQTFIKEAQAEKALNSLTKNRVVTEEQITAALNTQAKSIKEAQIQNKVLRQAVRELDLTTANASKTMEVYNRKIEENEKFIDGNVDSMTARKRNIGNYASAFNGLNMSVQQVVRELPSAAIGLNTFFLAISNNLPILADEIVRARQELKLMNEQGLKGTPVWKQLVTSLFSWQTAMIAGITVLSMHGKEIGEWVTGLFKGKERIDVLKESLKAYNETMLSGGKNAQEEVTKLRLLYSATQDLTKSQEDRLAASNELQRMYPDYFGNLSDEDILAGKAADSYTRLTESVIASAKAKAAMGKIVEEQGKIIENNQKITEATVRLTEAEADLKKEQETLNRMHGRIGLTGIINLEMNVSAASDKVEEIKKEIAEYNAAISNANELSKKLEKTIGVKDLIDTDGAKAGADDYADYMRNIEEQITEATISAIANRKEREIAEINAEYDAKESTIRGHSEKEEELRVLLASERASKIKQIETDYERDIQETNLNNMIAYAKEGSDAQLEYRIRLLELQREKEIEEAEKTGVDVLTVTKKYEQLIREAKEESASVAAERGISAMGANAFVDGAELNEQMRTLSEAYKNGNISREEYEAENMRIQQEYAEKQARLAVTTLKSALSTPDLSEDDKIKYAEELAKAEMELDNIVTDNKIANDEAEIKSEEEKRKRQIELLQTFSQLIGEFAKFGDQLFANKIDQLEEEEEANNEAYENEIERIEELEETGAITTEEAEARKRAAEDKTKAKNEEIAKKKAELQRKQAIFDKSMSAAQVTINTAQSISKTAAELGFPAAIPFIALAVAQGAIQLAAILATPIPKYKEGTSNHKGGLAVVGDGGKAETVLTPDGNYYLTPDIPTLVELPKGSKVFPENIFEDEDKYVRSDLLSLMDMRDGDGLPVIMVSNDFSGLERRLDKLERSMVRAFNDAAKESKKAQYEAFKNRF